MTTTWVKLGGGTFSSTLKGMSPSNCRENTDGHYPKNCFNGTFFEEEICNSPMKIWKLEYSNKNEKKCQKIDSPFFISIIICDLWNSTSTTPILLVFKNDNLLGTFFKEPKNSRKKAFFPDKLLLFFSRALHNKWRWYLKKSKNEEASLPKKPASYPNNLEFLDGPKMMCVN